MYLQNVRFLLAKQMALFLLCDNSSTCVLYDLYVVVVYEVWVFYLT